MADYVRTIWKDCPMCGSTKAIQLTAEDVIGIDKYNSGALVQDALPNMNPMEREFIVTGYCPRCQSLLFGTNYKSNRIK